VQTLSIVYVNNS